MAEFPDIGTHCSLQSCNRLDYLIFHCPGCKRSFCADHRFVHGCMKSEAEVSNPVYFSSVPVFKCSLAECTREEKTEIICSLCSEQFCMKHRNAEDHECVSLKRKQNMANQASYSMAKPPVSITAPKLKDSSKQIKADKLASMRLKAKNPFKVQTSELLVVFVTVRGGVRYPCLLCKTWTINRCRSSLLEQCFVKGENNLKLYKEVSNELQPIPLECTASEKLDDMGDYALSD